jgi:hypothetical protein
MPRDEMLRTTRHELSARPHGLDKKQPSDDDEKAQTNQACRKQYDSQKCIQQRLSYRSGLEVAIENHSFKVGCDAPHHF